VFNKTSLNTFLVPTAGSRNPADYYDYFKDWTEENFENEVVKTNATTVNALGIVNQHLSKLPSTGGEGTFAFTIAGALLSMGGSITLFGKKRKTNK
jgi:LPXTG-motif cell wall-anchored protein